MTIEQFAQKQADVPTDELIKIAREWVSKLCKTGGNAWSLRVPPSINDPDMVFGEVVRRLEKLAFPDAEMDKIAAEIAEMNDEEFENNLNLLEK